MATWDAALSPQTARAAPRLSRERFDALLAAVTLAAFSAPGMMFLGVSDDPAAPPTPALRLYWPPVYALTLLLCWRRRAELKRAWPAGLMLAAPCAWAWATQLWSISPDDTGRRGLALAMTTLFGFALGGGFSGERLVKTVASTAVWLAAASAVVAVLLPHYGVEQVVNVGLWRGLWDTKNALAAFMTVGAVAAACVVGMERCGRAKWLAAFVLCLFDLLMSQGKTSLICLLLSLVLLGFYHMARRGAAWAVLAGWAAGAGAVVAGFIGACFPDVFFHAIGKDPTLTGRTEIWSAVLAQVAERPLGGYGFGAFWVKDSVPAKIVASQTGWVAPEAHNAWLDMLAQVGWIGTILAGACCALALVLSIARARGRDDGLFAPVFIVTFLALSLAESVLLSPNGLIWVVFVAAFASLATPRRYRGASLIAPSSRMAAAFR